MTQESNKFSITRVAIGVWLLIAILTIGFCMSAKCQELTPWADTTCATAYTPSNPGPYAEDFGDEWVDIQGDTLTGVWVGNRFLVPSTSKAYGFNDCGITWDWVPDYGYANVKPAKYAFAYDDWSWENPALLGGLIATTVGYFYQGRAEGILTNEAKYRTPKGLHPRSSLSHTLRDQGNYLAIFGIATTALSMGWREYQLRQHAPKSGFWYSTKFWPTVGRVGTVIVLNAATAYGAAQAGYKREINNP